ncbi:hypothetical protein BGZ83_003009 [Gryganskiella cystojenkinii]|nr:hypothetical protein BGZ83_003009 [Gryganskiella cystojenkinii]
MTTTSRFSPVVFKRSFGRFLFNSLLILQSLALFLSSSTSPSFFASAGLQPGYCGDCQTFSNAISVCGGTFGPADIENLNGQEYVLQQQYQKCVCTDVIRQVLWNCAKCVTLGGHNAKAPPPTKYQTQCIAWGMTIDEWRAPYTGPVAEGTQADVTGGGGTNPPPPPPPPQTSSPSKATTTTDTKPTGGGGGDSDKSSSAISPSSSSDNSVSPSDKSESGVNSTAIGISVGIIGVAAVAGIVAVVMMKRRRRRRHLPLDLDPPAALRDYAGLTSSEDKWADDRYHTTNSSRHAHGGRQQHSPTMTPAPIASATPAIGQYGESVAGYSDHTAYDQYGGGRYQYDQYPSHPPTSYDGYSADGHGDFYADPSAGYGHHPQGGYPMQDFGYVNYEPRGQVNDQGQPVNRHPSGSSTSKPPLVPFDS